LELREKFKHGGTHAKEFPHKESKEKRMFVNVSETMGAAAGFVSTAAFLPQVIKVYRTGSTQGISLGMYVLYCLGIILWGVYAWTIQSWPLLMTEIITGIMSFYILRMKIKSVEDEGKP
jgi:MtN3 and saliva related transmembrane protein